jgi:hypothetical protein
MPEPGTRTITLRNEVVESVQREIKRTSPGAKLATFISELIDDSLLQRESMRDFAPFQFINAVDASVFVKDKIRGRVIELIVKDKVLTCTLDESIDCIHVGFAWGLPAVARVMKEHGARKPV